MLQKRNIVDEQKLQTMLQTCEENGFSNITPSPEFQPKGSRPLYCSKTFVPIVDGVYLYCRVCLSSFALTTKHKGEKCPCCSFGILLKGNSSIVVT